MVRRDLSFLLIGVLLTGCASFSYRYYGLRLDAASYENGTLLGPKATDDLPFTRCQPSEQVKNPCVVMLTPDFFKMKTDYEDTKQRLIDCEKD